MPYSYRTMLPDQYKAHMSHDIVILCPECHVRCEKATKTRMKGVEGGLREEFRRDASGENKEDVFCSPVIDDMELNHVRSCAIALVKWRDNMPLDKIESHETVVRDYLASTATEKENDTKSILLNTKIPLSKQQLQKACSVNYRVKNPNYVSGSELVMRFLDDDEKKIEEFIVDWRRHFVETVQPRFMPVGWSVDNPVVCGRTEKSGGDKDDSIKRW